MQAHFIIPTIFLYSVLTLDLESVWYNWTKRHALQQVIARSESLCNSFIYFVLHRCRMQPYIDQNVSRNSLSFNIFLKFKYIYIYILACIHTCAYTFLYYIFYILSPFLLYMLSKMGLCKSVLNYRRNDNSNEYYCFVNTIIWCL